MAWLKSMASLEDGGRSREWHRTENLDVLEGALEEDLELSPFNSLKLQAMVNSSLSETVYSSICHTDRMLSNVIFKDHILFMII